MLYLDSFNVFMQEYGSDSGSGGSGDGPLSDVGVGDPFAGFTFTPSNYRFTDPPRYFKANDPYYYEVDNIPLKELHENCLWLRDQMVGLELNVTGISTSQILDLQPSVNSADRVVRVQPGKFIGRVNDAYGLAPLFDQLDLQPVVDVTRNTIWEPPSITVSDEVFSTIVGQTVNNVLFSNGLYTNFQTHSSEIQKDAGVIVFNYDSLFLNPNPLSISLLPKISSAYWQQTSTDPSLQQLAVDFCRRWQGVFRNSVVNVSDPLEVEIPPFDATDYMDSAGNPSTPQVRIDLVFAYTHPIDSSQTYLLKDAGGAPERITSSRLGVVKGAGQFLTAQEGALDITTGSEIGSNNWVGQSTMPNRYYDTSGSLNPTQSMGIQAPLADQVGDGLTDLPFPGKTTGLSFPSPDDLLNAAPIIAQDAISNDLITLGQSVLPICYVIVKKDSTVLFSEDIIDIRPFLRTAELAYNERAGVGAANPPLSMGNPATSKAELYTTVEATRDYFISLLQTQSDDFKQIIQDNLVIPQATLASVIRDNGSAQGGGAFFPLTFQSDKTTYNSPSLGMSTEYTNVNGGKVFPDNIDGATTVRLIPGIYHIEGNVTIMPAAVLDSGYHKWYLGILDGTTQVFPATPTDARTYAFFDHGDSYRQMTGSISFSYIHGVNPTDTYSDVSIVLKSDGGQTGYINGGLTITRLSNYDGGAGPMPGAIGV